jgi:hypothetical protein
VRALLALLLALAGCAPVHPWERARLVAPVMVWPADPLEAGFDEHAITSREGLSGASAAGGASCGCD